jgi:hypothetical protein
MSLDFNLSFGYVPTFSPVPLVTSIETSYIKVKVYPLFYKKVIVEWTIPATWGNCVFNVYKSDIEDGSWALVNPTPISGTNFLEDITTEDFSKFRKTYYKVEVQLPLPDGRRIISPVTTWEKVRNNLVQLRAQEITRREKILLDKFTGVDSLIFRRKYFGQRCPKCYNIDIEKVTQDHCTTCYGTSFLGGYFPGLPTKLCYEISPDNTQLTYSGKVETNQTSAWTVSYPAIGTLDIIVRIPDFRVFRVEGVNATELQTVQVRQVMQLVELSKGSVEMSLMDTLVNPSHYLPSLSGTKSKSSSGCII